MRGVVGATEVRKVRCGEADLLGEAWVVEVGISSPQESL